jgi:hypothetical protein
MASLHRPVVVPIHLGVRLWRSDFSKAGTEALKASVASGPPPVKSVTALRVVTPLLAEPVANRPNWTIAGSVATF